VLQYFYELTSPTLTAMVSSVSANAGTHFTIVQVNTKMHNGNWHNQYRQF